MKTYDWIVIGGGIGGVALSYELARQGLQVLLIEQSVNLTGASRFSMEELPTGLVQLL